MCKRLSAWAALDCYLAALTLMQAKSSTRFKLLHAVGASTLAGLGDNMQAACLSELCTELQQLGWMSAAKHCCVWAMAANEAGMCADLRRRRFELAGSLVDILTQARLSMVGTWCPQQT